MVTGQLLWWVFLSVGTSLKIAADRKCDLVSGAGTILAGAQ